MSDTMFWILIIAVAVIVVGLIILMIIARIKVTTTMISALSSNITDIAKEKIHNDSIKLQNEHIKLRGHAVKCEWCGVEHTFKDVSDIPINCPNCGGSLTYDKQIDENEFNEKRMKARDSKIALALAFSPIIFGILVSILDWIFKR